MYSAKKFAVLQKITIDSKDLENDATRHYENDVSNSTNYCRVVFTGVI